MNVAIYPVEHRQALQLAQKGRQGGQYSDNDQVGE